jgi:hypothetical protein
MICIDEIHSGMRKKFPRSFPSGIAQNLNGFLKDFAFDNSLLSADLPQSFHLFRSRQNNL